MNVQCDNEIQLQAACFKLQAKAEERKSEVRGMMARQLVTL